MWSAVFIFLVKILFGKEVLQMLVRLYAGEVILEKITIDDVPRGLRERVKAYLVEMGCIDAQSLGRTGVPTTVYAMILRR